MRRTSGLDTIQRSLEDLESPACHSGGSQHHRLAGAIGRAGRLFLLLLCATTAAACGSTSTSAVGPSPVKCSVSLSGPSQIAPGGGTSTVAVSTQPECSWTASTQASWLTVKPASGQGPGQIQLDVAPNPAPTARESELAVNDSRASIRQSPSPCNFEVSPAATTVPAAGGPRDFTVNAIGGCAWTASSGASWVTIMSGGAGNGTGTINVQVAANGGSARAGDLTVGGQTITVSQSAGGASACSYLAQPSFFAAPAAGGPGSASVTSVTGCAWTATSDASWLTITSGAGGSGNGTVAFSVASNGTTPRTGHLTIEGQTVTVSQTAQACDFAVQPGSASAPASGGPFSVSVTVASGCAWTAASQASWLAVTSGASGSGNGSVAVNVSPNAGPARTGTLAIAGVIFQVSQADGCSYDIQPSTFAAAKGGGSSSTDVTAGAGCGWTATSQVPWVVLTAGGSGNGHGTVNFTVGTNSGPARQGTFVVAGSSSSRTFTVNQESGCAYSLSPTSLSIASTGGNRTTNVSTEPGCAWTVTESVDWITVTAGAAGTDSGTVAFTVAPNPGPQRQTTITIAGVAFNVTQASGCTVTDVTPATAKFGAGGGQQTMTFKVSAPTCTWTVSPEASWITLGPNSPPTGAGDGTILYVVAPWLTPRTATIRITSDASTAVHSVIQN